jgi:hypothetical protein
LLQSKLNGKIFSDGSTALAGRLHFTLSEALGEGGVEFLFKFLLYARSIWKTNNNPPYLIIIVQIIARYVF